jgi:hypothetical protein
MSRTFNVRLLYKGGIHRPQTQSSYANIKDLGNTFNLNQHFLIFTKFEVHVGGKEIMMFHFYYTQTDLALIHINIVHQYIVDTHPNDSN